MKDSTGHEVNLDSYFNEPEPPRDCRDGRNCDGCEWCLLARGDTPAPVFVCVCGYSEDAHDVLVEEEVPYKNGTTIIEHWTCPAGECRDFEVDS